jgi:hypothetical protein
MRKNGRITMTADAVDKKISVFGVKTSPFRERHNL